MKFLGKFFLTLLLLILLGLVVLYVLLQTQWGAGWFSRWVSDKTAWHLSLSKIEHNFSSPSHIMLDDFSFGHDGQPAVLVAKRVDLGLALVQFSDWLHFDSIDVRDGEINLANQTPDTTLPIQANRLQLNNVRIDSPHSMLPMIAERVNGGIIPWKPTPTDMLGSDAQFQMSAGMLTLDGVPGNNVLLQGSVKQHRMIFSNIGADLARGSMTGNAERDAQGNWKIDQLRLNDIRLQTHQNLSDFLNPLRDVPSVSINRLDMTDARLQGPDWAVTDLDLTLKNITLRGDDWQSDDGSLSMNAGNFINGGFELNDPIVNANFSAQGIELAQFSSRWANGVIRASGNWTRSDKRLTLSDLAIAGLEYTLPQNWRDRWQQALPSWLDSVLVTHATANRNLVIDINPAFPFQMTALDGNADNLLLARQHQWGIWGGKASFNAAEATFNRTDLRHPSIAFNANDQQIQVTEMSAFNGNGLLEGTASVGQDAQRPLTLNLKGQAVPANVLQNWGWPALPLSGNSNLLLQAKGSLSAAAPLRQSVEGNLSVTTDTQSVQQTMHAGQVQ
ncbi:MULTISPECIES: AsmA family protein [unclassified Pantoea]|uniref:AsmA family protein n=1 Tax=unclassified Pantoea TaxID=2630326 RepID=UPI001CD39952|nr:MULTISPECIES: AsmA family protein [unclassified Pantoea]MCA1179684.1 AsmA family protein [Pantoea sp. alder69]MCA1253343.1 AsmA family protein [Pantoea sp. alder70]MCA1268027.1 AsmA family protein [Pantoea sp. alder81]